MPRDTDGKVSSRSCVLSAAEDGSTEELWTWPVLTASAVHDVPCPPRGRCWPHTQRKVQGGHCPAWETSNEHLGTARGHDLSRDDNGIRY